MKSILAILLLAFSVNAFAITEEDLVPVENAVSVFNDSEEVRYKSVEEVFHNFGNRAIFGLFGTDAIVAFLGSSTSELVKEEIRGFTFAERKQYTAPISPATGDAVSMMFDIMYAAIILFWMIKLYNYYTERSFAAMAEGNLDKASHGSFIGPLLRSGAVVAFALPTGGLIYDALLSEDADNKIDPANPIQADEYVSEDSGSVYSPLHNAIFNAVGVAFRMTDTMENDFLSTSPQFFPVYVIPKPDVAEVAMTEVLDWGICANGAMGVSNVAVGVNSEIVDGTYSVNAVAGGCTLSIATKIDGTTSDMLANNPELSEKSGITAEAFMHQQKRALDTVFKSVVSRAAAFGQKASRVIDSTPKSQLDKAAQGIVDVADWHNSCPSDLSTLIQRNEILNIMQARAMAAKCLSQVVVEKLSYPAELEADMDDKYMRGEYLMGSRQHELCTMTTDLGLANANFESIHECAKKQCDLLDGEAKRSNLFECSVAVQSLKKRLDFQSSLDKGFLFAGSTYMDSLELQSLPASPRKVLNHISAETEIDFEYSDARLDANKDAAFNVREKEDGSYSYLANIEVSSYAGDRMEQYETYFDESREKIQLNVINEPSFYIDAVNSFQANAFMSALQPVRKMTMCLSNPNTVLTGVGICYDPLTEMRNLGHTLINAYIAITSGRYINKLFDIGARSIDSRLKDVSGTVKEKKSPLLKKFSNFVRDNGGLVITVTGAGAVLGIPQLIKNFSDSDVDDHYSQVVDTDLFESTEIMVLIGYALASAERAAESSALSSMLWVMLLIPGVVMAFIIPLVPLFSFAIATLLMLTTLFATFIVSPFIFMNVLTATGNDMSAQVKKAGMHWLELMFRGPLLLGGLYFAIKIMSALMPFLLNHSLLGVVVTGNVSDEIGFIAMALELIVYFLLMVMLVFFSMDLITSFHDSLKSILFNSSMAVDGEGDSRTTMNENRKMVQGLLADSRR